MSTIKAVPLMLICAALSITVSAQTLENFIPLSTTVDGERRAGAVYVPPGYDPNLSYPLIVFLHGSGERGNDGASQTTVGIGKAIRENPDRFPCIVYMPQCAAEDRWVERPGQNGSTAHLHITAGIEKVLAQYAISEDKITLTGLSMGGGGTIVYGGLNPDRFAAFAPVCGRGSNRFAKGLAKRPVWALHGDADTVIPVETSKRIVEAVKEEGGDAKLTIYEGVGHNSWDRAYSKEQGLIEWLLQQSK